jgi:nucleosome binding factor SPN SPT16 subunit
LADHLPKSLGYATGLDFRETAFSLTAKNAASFKKGMVFCLSLGFQNVELTESDVSNTPDKSPVSAPDTDACLSFIALLLFIRFALIDNT